MSQIEAVKILEQTGKIKSTQRNFKGNVCNIILTRKRPHCQKASVCHFAPYILLC